MAFIENKKKIFFREYFLFVFIDYSISSRMARDIVELNESLLIDSNIKATTMAEIYESFYRRRNNLEIRDCGGENKQGKCMWK